MTMMFVSSLARTRIERAGINAQRETRATEACEIKSPVPELRAQPVEEVTRPDPLEPFMASLLEGAHPATLMPHPSRSIIREVAQKHEISIEQLCGSRRLQKYVRARQEACWRLRLEARLSLPEIGRRLGGKDHTTILHAVRTHASRHALPIPRGKP